MDLVPPALDYRCLFFQRSRKTSKDCKPSKKPPLGGLPSLLKNTAGEGGLLEDAANDRGKVTKSGVKTAFTAIPDPDNDEEGNALLNCWVLMEDDSRASKALREARATLNREVLDTYADLDKTDIAVLVVEDKWLASIQGGIEDQTHRITQQLAERLIELEKRYAHPLSELEREVSVLNKGVKDHLDQMGMSS